MRMTEIQKLDLQIRELQAQQRKLRNSDKTKVLLQVPRDMREYLYKKAKQLKTTTSGFIRDLINASRQDTHGQENLKKNS